MALTVLKRFYNQGIRVLGLGTNDRIVFGGYTLLTLLLRSPKE